MQRSRSASETRIGVGGPRCRRSSPTPYRGRRRTPAFTRRRASPQCRRAAPPCAESSTANASPRCSTCLDEPSIWRAPTAFFDPVDSALGARRRRVAWLLRHRPRGHGAASAPSEPADPKEKYELRSAGGSQASDLSRKQHSRIWANSEASSGLPVASSSNELSLLSRLTSTVSGSGCPRESGQLACYEVWVFVH